MKLLNSRDYLEEYAKVQHPENIEVALMYLNSYGNGNKLLKDGTRRIAKILAETPINLAHYAHTHDDFSELSIKGIGDKTKKRLTRILKNESKNSAFTTQRT